MDHRDELLEHLRRHVQAENDVRRGICLLNAGRYEQAAAAFRRALELGCDGRSLPAYLASALRGQGRHAEAAEVLERPAASAGAGAAEVIRHALAVWEAGEPQRAVSLLRRAVREDRDNAELQYQLGLLLARLDEREEAELRFVQAVLIDRRHVDALVSLALCRAMQGAWREALSHLQEAQALRPTDARIGLLLTQAAAAVEREGGYPRVQTVMPPDDPAADEEGIAELSRIIEDDPDFVDAFLALPAETVGERVFAMLLRTLEKALERQPEHAELHFHCGQVLERLGRSGEAIERTERAVAIDPAYVRALIALGRLYQRTDRRDDARVRLEQALAAGAEYADVYYLLGNLYRQEGLWTRARQAYRRALSINARYEAAREALAALPA